MKKEILKYAFINSFLTALYIGGVSSLFFYGENIIPKEDTVFMPMMMLMLFVFSASITSTLVLGRPILWYLDGRKNEAISLFLSTLAVFFVVLVLVFLLVIGINA